MRAKKNFVCILGDHVLEAVAVERDLGVLISSEFKFSKYWMKLDNQGNQTLGFTARNFKYKSRCIAIPIYKFILRPQLTVNRLTNFCRLSSERT